MRTEFPSREGEDLATVSPHTSQLEEMISNLSARMELSHLLVLPGHARCHYATRRQLPMSTHVTCNDNPSGFPESNRVSPRQDEADYRLP